MLISDNSYYLLKLGVCISNVKLISMVNCVVVFNIRILFWDK